MFDNIPLLDGTEITNAPAPYQFGLVIRVRDYETDSQGIVNNANYLHYLEMSRHAFCRWRGFSFHDMTDKGIIAVMRRAEIDYLHPLHGDELFVSFLAVHREGPRFVFRQDLYRLPGGEPIIRALTTVVATVNGHLSKGDDLEPLLMDNQPG